ncbi:hypothetical protein CEP51_001301 [Fusarium floridanum]|uniref:PLC-like phosphodiesterase n=1 Tax=Fusarium floridanum TaxID=1325733 RepID=A0A428SHM7_9HYPO|nr:hypothetical protein CEP51_001301 [Fusarium floridanum]
MLSRLLLGAVALASFVTAAPAFEPTTHPVEIRSDGEGSGVELWEQNESGGLERRGKRGSYFLLVNATPWKMTLSGRSSYQMNVWEFPVTIAPGTSNRIYIEGKGHIDDGGEVSYRFEDLPGHPDFEFRYSGKLGTNRVPGAGVSFTSLETVNNNIGSFHKLEWRQDNNMPFIIASSEENPENPSIHPWLVSTNPPRDWMHATYPRISCLKLRELAISGTHDSGMSLFNGGSGLGLDANTLTQELSVAGQLEFGARWFDIRPSKTGGKWATGHYSFGAGNWHGGNGEYLDDIIDGINRFTEHNKELIILNVAQGLNSDNFNGDSDAKISQAEWEDVMRKLERINYRVENRGGEEDLSQLRVSDFIQDHAAVIIIVDADLYKSQDRVDLSAFADKGFFRRDQLPLYDRYADENNQNKMIADQLDKMRKERTSPASSMFLLSWTLTQTPLSVLGNGVIENSKGANRALIEKLWPAMSSSTYPNIINVDAYPSNRDFAALSMAINYHFAPRC